MPELPEVETVVRYIRPKLVGKRIQNAILPQHYKRALTGISLTAFNRGVQDQAIVSVTRRAKYIIINLSHACIAIHLRMTGRLLFNAIRPDELKYVTFQLLFTDKTTLYFKDVRKFGRIELLSSVSDLDEKLGVEPLSDEFNYPTFLALLKGKSRSIKPFLLDQKYIVGLGNIYVDEVLWHARIHPLSKTDQIPIRKLKVLHQVIPRVLKRSIELNGTTFQSFYFGEEASGEFVDQLNVFAREGQACPRCKRLIIKLKVGQRGTHLCPKCQQ